jgi:predicted acetyltransferase
VIERLLELYCYDFSEFNGSDVDADGAYRYPYSGLYWSEPERVPFLMRAGGRWAGFALVRGGEVHDMAEFFVMRKYRRTGLGRAAAEQIFARFPGPWTVRQQISNPAATTFWRAAIPYRFTETSTETEVIQRFDADR